MSLDRRRFLTVSAASLSGALLAACGANPDAGTLLDFAERKNEGLERSIFRHSTMDNVPASAKLAGKDFPKYFISKTVPVWDPAVRGPWQLPTRRGQSLGIASWLGLPAHVPNL